MSGPLDSPTGGTMPMGEAQRRCVESCPAGSGPNYWALAYVCTLPQADRGPTLRLRPAASKNTLIYPTRIRDRGIEHEAVVLDRTQRSSWARLWALDLHDLTISEFGGSEGQRWLGELIEAFCRASRVVL